MSITSEQIKGKALELGFCKVGVVRTEKLESESTNFFQWLALGRHGEMAWMEREPEKRTDPALNFPDARSMVVVAMNYFTPHEHVNSDELGKISRYAWGDDYHEILKAKLRELLDWIKTDSPEIEGKVCVDTTPVMEKAWAVRAGIGWLGKHSNVITTERGSWIFLGELILDVELEYDDEVIADHCGSCTACLDACPTNAIVEPYVVDSTKCISYATIELRDESLPTDIAENLNGWLYGCDICQDVCPWNRFETPTDETRFEARLGETSIDLKSLAKMNHAEYIERFRGSAMKRTKLTGLQRNAKHLSK